MNTTPLTNAAIAAALEQYAVMLQLAGESSFRARAYTRAAESVLAADAPMREFVAGQRLSELPGVGEGLAAAITELATNGVYTPLAELSALVPTGLIDVLAIQGVGIKTTIKLHQTLGVTDLETLSSALADGRIDDAKGLGKRVAATVRTGLASLERRSGRLRLGTIRPVAVNLVAAISAALPGAEVALAGSVRRWEETAADIDLVVGTDDPAAAAAAIAALPIVASVEHRVDQLSLRLENGIPVDVYWVPPDRFGTMLATVTGPPAHLTLLPTPATAAATEAEFYAANGIPWIPPELRAGESELALVDLIPGLITVADIRGEFHCHTTWSDGSGSVQAMAEAALARGYEFLGISDHSHGLGVANGLTAERLWAQSIEIQAAAAATGLRLLRSCEVEVHRDGRLDFPDEVLAELDVVIASLHVGLRQPQPELTGRLLGVLANRHVDIIAHPSGRLIEQRDPGDFDWPAVFAAAAASGTALEINADPARLDLHPAHAAAALAAGVLLTINCDAHSPGGFDQLEYGVMVARKAWATPDRVLNCWSLAAIEAWLAARAATP